MLKDNKSLYDKFIPIAEEYAYHDIPWTTVVLVNEWKDKKNKEKCTFSDGKDICFSINKKRFTHIQNAKLGNVFEIKLHKSEIPVLLRLSDKDDWYNLDDEYAVVDYINEEKNVIHVITCRNKEVFFKDNIDKFKINDFIKGKKYFSRKGNVQQIKIINVSSININEVIDKFPKFISVVDHINSKKKLFHYIADKKSCNNNHLKLILLNRHEYVYEDLHGTISDNSTLIRPKIGDFLEVWIVKKYIGPEKKVVFKAVHVKETSEQLINIVKEIEGNLELKFKRNGKTLDLIDIEISGVDDMLNIDPDFGFVDDYYVPKSVLKQNKIIWNCKVQGKAINFENQWKVIKLNKIL